MCTYTNCFALQVGITLTLTLTLIHFYYLVSVDSSLSPYADKVGLSIFFFFRYIRTYVRKYFSNELKIIDIKSQVMFGLLVMQNTVSQTWILEKACRGWFTRPGRSIRSRLSGDAQAAGPKVTQSSKAYGRLQPSFRLGIWMRLT